MNKCAALAAIVAVVALTGCATAEDTARDQRCAELQATVIEGNGQAMDAARDAVDQAIGRLCR